jgi:hypothetical protein
MYHHHRHPQGPRVRKSRRGRREKPPGVPPGPPDGASQWEATHAPLHGHASIGQFGTNAIANANDRCAGERPPGMRNPAAAVDNPATSGALKHSMKMRTAAGKVRPRRPAWEARLLRDAQSADSRKEVDFPRLPLVPTGRAGSSALFPLSPRQCAICTDSHSLTGRPPCPVPFPNVPGFLPGYAALTRIFSQFFARACKILLPGICCA